ncbi:ABC transporter substrate-binding protein [Halobacteriaceae archaeon SHR40]|uniref:ABC transporter substrate-binding protein n=1 Tax=Halovenus amylolytica TaxID=2500550 RepID=UPI000FE2E35A
MVDQSRRRDLLKAIGAGGTIALAGCLADDEGDDGNGGGDGDGGGDGNETGDDGGGDGGIGRTINLGLLMGVTGGLEELGPPIRDAAQLVPGQFDDADTELEIQTQFEDTETDPTVGVSGAEALDDAGYPMFVGALASAVSLEVAESVSIPRGIVQNSPASTAPGYSDLEADFTFRTAVPDSFQGEVLAQIAAERLEAGSAATLAQDDAYGQGLSSTFADSFENQYDGEITGSEIFPEGQTSYTAQLENVLADDPDTLLIVAFPEDGERIFSDFYTNFDRPDMDILVSDGLQDSGLPDAVGFDMTNVTGTAPIGSGPGVDTFNQLYQDAYDEDPSGEPFVRQSYDAAATLVLANAAAGENDGEAVRDEVRNVTSSGGEEVLPENLVEGAEMAAEGEEIQYRGVSGEITYDENGDQSNVSYEYFGFTEDGLEEIETIQL